MATVPYFLWPRQDCPSVTAEEPSLLGEHQQKFKTLFGFPLACYGNGLSRRLGGTYSFRFGCTWQSSRLWSAVAKRFQRGQLLLEFEYGFEEVAQFFHALQYLVRGKHQQAGIILL